MKSARNGSRFLLIVAFSSLGVCLLSSIFWVRSYRLARPHSDVLNIRTTDPLWWIISAEGHATLCRQNGRDWGNEWKICDRFGFRLGGLHGPNGSLWNLQVPYWFITLILFTPAALVLFGRLRRRHFREGLCPNCGYDIRATPHRCPECGTSMMSNTAA